MNIPALRALRVPGMVLGILLGTLCLAASAMAQQSYAPFEPAPHERAAAMIEQQGPNFSSPWGLIVAGGWVMIPLGVLSVIAVALVVVYLFTLRSRAIATPLFMNTAEALLKKGDFLGLLAISNRHGEAVSRVVQRTLDFATKNPDADFEMVREVLETEGTRQASGINQQITYLADVGAIAPMIGLFGTVVGMIQSFAALSGDMAAQKSTMLAEGVSVALIATAAGLIIGIPALGLYAYFRGQAQKLIAELEAASTHILAFLSLNYQKVEEGEEVVPARTPAVSETRGQRRLG